MIPPIFSVCAASTPVTALLGATPTRLFLFGEASQNVTKPYAVWQTVGGSPENYLGTLPDIDNVILQIDVYAVSADSARQVAQALRDAVEPYAHVTSYGGDGRDETTNNYRWSLTVDWFVPR